MPPKRPVVSGRDAVRALERTGFVFDRQRGSHVYLWHPEKRRGVSVPCHAGEELRPGILASILRQAGAIYSGFRPATTERPHGSGAPGAVAGHPRGLLQCPGREVDSGGHGTQTPEEATTTGADRRPVAATKDPRVEALATFLLHMLDDGLLEEDSTETPEAPA